MAGEINYGLLNPNTAALAAGSVLAGQQAAEERQANKLRQQMQMQQFGQEQQMNALKMQQAQQEMADQNALRDIYRTSGGDVNKLYEGAMGAGLGKQAMEFQKMQREQQAEKVKQAGEHLKLMKGLATNVMANPTFETAAASLQQFSAITGQDMSQEISRLQAIGSNPDAIRQWAAGHSLEADKLLPKFQNISAGGYEQLGTTDYTGKFTPTQRIEKTLTPGEIQSNITTIRGQNLVNARGIEANRLKAQENIINEKGVVGKQVREVEMKLQDDYRAESKGFNETATAMKKVLGSIETADKNPGSALAAGTAFMKLLDPNSVVRESELGMALNASGWFDRAMNTAQQLQSGKIMTATQKANLKKASQDLFEEAKAAQREVDAAYEQRAQAYGADPSRIIVDRGQKPKPSANKAKSLPTGWSVEEH